MGKENSYQRNGFDNREAYLKNLADTTGVPEEMVFAAADVLGPGEDFDGLVTALEDGF